MSRILNIDTALSTASLSLCENGNELSRRVNNNDRDHATWIHTAIKDLINEAGKNMQDLDAIAVSAGPGSYTGLRIGLSAAKGLCYTLNIPLITISTLDIMAAAALEEVPELVTAIDLFCPMIDARRMEVYFALYDTGGKQVHKPSAVLLDSEFLSDRAEKTILFFGSGSKKWESFVQKKQFLFADFKFVGSYHMRKKSLQLYDNGVFADLISSEPLYIKEFYDTRDK